MVEVDNILEGRAKTGIVPPLWDGHAAERIRDILINELSTVPGANEIS
jgi:UDP-N-acetylglucosamine 2-epimerase (non-hydrolysing)